jgi:hypothetical protein
VAKRKELATGRFDERLIAARVEARRRAKGIEVKAICAEIGMEKWDWSRKVRLDNSSFSIAELSKIAEILDAPPGWPFLDESLGMMIEMSARRRRFPKEDDAASQREHAPK